MPGPIRDEWLPPLAGLKDWFKEMVENLKSDPPPALNSVLADFSNFVRRNGDIYQQLNEMIDQAKEPKACVLCTHVLTYSHQ